MGEHRVAQRVALAALILAGLLPAQPARASVLCAGGSAGNVPCQDEGPCEHSAVERMAVWARGGVGAEVSLTCGGELVARCVVSDALVGACKSGLLPVGGAGVSEFKVAGAAVCTATGPITAAVCATEPGPPGVHHNAINIVFIGTATVCADDVPQKQHAVNCGPPRSQGLYLIGQPGRDGLADTTKWTNRRGTYRFTTSVCDVTTPSGVKKLCELDVSGDLEPLHGVGAACGVSRGVNGVGDLFFSNGSRYDITALGWATSVGGTLPIRGSYRYLEAGGFKSPVDPATDEGDLVGLAQTQGGAACIKSGSDGSGASVFNLVGSLELLPGNR